MCVVVELMGVIYQRMAELWTLKQQRTLTDEEYTEFVHCLNANARHYWRLAELENLSLMASMTSDIDWLHDICARIDKLQKKI